MWCIKCYEDDHRVKIKFFETEKSAMDSINDRNQLLPYHVKYSNLVEYATGFDFEIGGRKFRYVVEYIDNISDLGWL